MASQTTTANPELLQEQVANILVQPLEAASVVLSSGVRIFDTSSPLRIPKLVAGASVGFVAEGGLIPEADVDFGEISLMPSTLKSLKVLIRFSTNCCGSPSSASTPPSVSASSPTCPTTSTPRC